MLAIAGSASAAMAEQITCESHHNNAEACGTVQPGSSVRMAQQLSSSPCIEGRTWGNGDDSIWVSGGCRAVFEVTPPQSRGEASRYDRDDRDRYADERQQEYSARDNDNDAARDNDAEDRGDDRRDERRDEHRDGRRYARIEQRRERARVACIDRAVSGQSYGPSDVHANDVRWIGEGRLEVSLDSPDGPLTCTVDRDGNVTLE